MLRFQRMHIIYIAADHRGLSLVQALLPFLRTQGYEVHDLTPPLDTDGIIDFPVAAQAVAKQVATYNALGVLICGSGIGMAIAANRFKGVRAGAIHTVEEASLAKAHNHLNIACLGANLLDEAQAKAIIQAWLAATPDEDSKRARRIAEIDEYGS